MKIPQKVSQLPYPTLASTDRWVVVPNRWENQSRISLPSLTYQILIQHWAKTGFGQVLAVGVK